MALTRGKWGEDIDPGGKWTQLDGPVRWVRALGGLVLLMLGLMGVGAALRAVVFGSAGPAHWKMLFLHVLLACLGMFLLRANKGKV